MARQNRLLRYRIRILYRNESTTGEEPVSYTHLDVYKRQDDKDAALEKFKITFQKQRLWNEVLKIEKNADAQLGRSFEFSLPKEWSRQEQIDYTTEYIQKTFVDKGMCADWSIHDKNDGNPHVHLPVSYTHLDVYKRQA